MGSGAWLESEQEGLLCTGRSFCFVKEQRPILHMSFKSDQILISPQLCLASVSLVWDKNRWNRKTMLETPAASLG